MSDLIECPEWYENQLRISSEMDEQAWNKMTRLLPSRKNTTPYHSGSHSLKYFRTLKELGFIGGDMYEIGFCLGHSATAFLEMGATCVWSNDISDREETLLAASIMKEAWGARFEFNKTPHVPIHSAFIDGGHDFDDVDNDIAKCKSLGVTRFIFDDFFPKWGPGVQPAIRKHNLSIKAIVGGMAACTL